MKAKGYGRTDNGRVRDHNEDALLIDEELGLFLVSDGLGGHNAGEIASQRACEVVQRELQRQQDQLERHRLQGEYSRAAHILRQAIRTACKVIFDEGQENEDRRGMAATLVALLVVGDIGIVGHVGDSRLYMLREKQAHMLTEDHTLVLEQLRTGAITREEASRSRLGSVVTRALGLSSDCIVDTLEVELAGGDAYVLCSDGLSDYVAAKELHKIYESAPLQDLPEHAVNLANARGGADNITVVTVGILFETQTQPERKIDALQKIPLFRHLSYKDLIKVLNVVQVVCRGPGDIIIEEGDTSEELFILIDGDAEVRKAGQRLAELGRHSFFGEMGMIDNAPRSADVVAVSECELLSIKRKDFYRLLRSDPFLAVKVLSAFCQVLNDRLRKTSGELTGIKKQMVDSFTTVADSWFIDEPTQLLKDIEEDVEVVEPTPPDESK